jgi:hypothetical protein
VHGGYRAGSAASALSSAVSGSGPHRVNVPSAHAIVTVARAPLLVTVTDAPASSAAWRFATRCRWSARSAIIVLSRFLLRAGVARRGASPPLSAGRRRSLLVIVRVRPSACVLPARVGARGADGRTIAADLDRAIPLHRQVLADRERLYGPDHHYTDIARQLLAVPSNSKTPAGARPCHVAARSTSDVPAPVSLGLSARAVRAQRCRRSRRGSQRSRHRMEGVRRAAISRPLVPVR